MGKDEDYFMNGQTQRTRTESPTQHAPPPTGDMQDALADPLQAKGDINGSDQTRAVAAQGASGGGTALPFQSQIQSSFGKFDVSEVRAHTGSDAPGKVGADAYATGKNVVFGDSPNLHLAAHEAAHVVQQQGGVSLKGGVGEEGDPYEQHADAVADKVVAGESAEELLGTVAKGGGSTAAPVQMARSKKGGRSSKKAVVEDVSSDEEEEAVVVSEGDASQSLMVKIGALGTGDGTTLSALKRLAEEYAEVQEDLDEHDCDPEANEMELQPYELAQALGRKYNELATDIESRVDELKDDLTDKLTSLKAAPLYTQLAKKSVKDAAADLSTKLDLVEPTDEKEDLVDSLDQVITASDSMKALKQARTNGWIQFPSSAAGLGQMLGVTMSSVADGPTTPGRNKYTTSVGGVGFTCEAHPYDAGAPAFHKNLHFHTSTEGNSHSHGRMPGDIMLTSMYMGSLD